MVVELLFPGALPLASAGVGGFLHVFLFLHCRELSSSGCAVQCSLPCILPSHHVCIGLPYGAPNVKFRKSLPGRRSSCERCLVLGIRMAMSFAMAELVSAKAKDFANLMRIDNINMRSYRCLFNIVTLSACLQG